MQNPSLMQPSDQLTPNADDAGLLVRFFVKPLQDQGESIRQGRPVFRDREYIEIRTPGKRDPVCRPAKPGDINRFPRHYQAYKDRTEGELEEGTPLTEWPQISRSMAEELSFYNVKTVEQLVSMSDQHATQFMGIHGLRRQAKEWLELAGEQAAAAELHAQLSERDEEIADLKAAMQKMQASIDDMKPKKKAAPKKKTARRKVTAKKE